MGELLFRYFGLDPTQTYSYALDTLRDSRLKVSKVSDFNDPFEFRMRLKKVSAKEWDEYFEKAIRTASTGNPDPLITQVLLDRPIECNYDILEAAKIVRENKKAFISQLKANNEFAKGRIETLLKEADSHFRIVCFSSSRVSPEEEILLWSHYGAMHKGVRIGFDFSETKNNFRIEEMIYQSERVEWNSILNDPDYDKEVLSRVTRTKCNGWSYEKEHRLFTSPEQCISEGSLEFVNFDPKSIVRVDFPIRVPDVVKNSILEMVSKVCPWAIISQARHHNSDYALTYDQMCHLTNPPLARRP